jgi:hypothetical protein
MSRMAGWGTVGVGAPEGTTALAVKDEEEVPLVVGAGGQPLQGNAGVWASDLSTLYKV